MSAPFPHDPTWGNRTNVHNPQGGPPQDAWPAQMTSQPAGYSPQLQQTYLNNNVAGKPPVQVGYGAPLSSWNRVPSTQQPAPSMPYNQHQQHGNPGYTPNVGGYPSQVASPTPFTPPATHYSQPPVQQQQPHPQHLQQHPQRQQMFAPVAGPPLQQPPQAMPGDDPWSWGWEESSSDSPATSTPNNNWGSQQGFNSVQNYFQPTGQQQRPSGPAVASVEEPEPAGSALTVENVEGVDARLGRTGGSTAESVQSFQSGSNISDVKTDRLSPDPGKIPLTTQALREFHNEVYQNGPSGIRHGTDGLTPQWSIESQMSQETASDDISPSIAGCSDADSAPMPGWQEEAPYIDPELAGRLASINLGGTENREVAPPDQRQNVVASVPIAEARSTDAFNGYQVQHKEPEVGYPRSSPVPPSSFPVAPPPHNASAWQKDQQEMLPSNRSLPGAPEPYGARGDVGYPAHRVTETIPPHLPPSGWNKDLGMQQVLRSDAQGPEQSGPRGYAPPLETKPPVQGVSSARSTDVQTTPIVARPPSGSTGDGYNPSHVSVAPGAPLPSAWSQDSREMEPSGRPPLPMPPSTRTQPSSQPAFPQARQTYGHSGDGFGAPQHNFEPGAPHSTAWTKDIRDGESNVRPPPRTYEAFGDGEFSVPPSNRPTETLHNLPPKVPSPAWSQERLGTPPSSRLPPRALDNYGDGAFSVVASSAPPSDFRPAALPFQPPSYQTSADVPSRPEGQPSPLPASQPEPYSSRQSDSFVASGPLNTTAPYQNRTTASEDVVNLETIPDNKERPDVELRSGRFSAPHAPSWYGGGPENQEVAPRGDRNEYLETGRLMEQDTISLNESGTDADGGEYLPPPGLSRLVPGENHSVEIGTPPPGLDRMVLGQLNEGDQTLPLSLPHGTPPPVGLDRMVPGQVHDEPTAGLRRMVPGESSSPEVQTGSPPPVESPREARVVPGVARDEPVAPTIPVAVSPVVRRPSLSPSPDTQSRLQPQTERSETIGSDHVDVFPTNTNDNSNKSSKRREKERLRDEGSSDERDSNRRQRDGDFYRGRDRDRDESSAGERRRVDWDRHRKSPQRYRDYRDDRRRRKEYDYSDEEDRDASGYYSDRDRRNLSNMSGYREDYDRTFPRRDDRARSLRPEKVARDRNDDKRDGHDRRRRGYERDRERDRQGEYYRRRPNEDGEDFRDQRSRPSSRNDSSVHDFKHRGMTARPDFDRESERDHNRSYSKRERDRDPYYPQGNPVAGGFNYDPNVYFYYQYYENLRRTNPAAYAEYYRKYYASSQHGTYSEDRGSVHSGRSSANEDTKERILESSLHADEPEIPQRLTPTKFTTAHVKGILTVRGQLIKIMAHYPLDGHPASIDIHDSLTCLDDIRQQLQEFPGPLVKGVTHKNNVVRYCKLKIKEAEANPELFDKDSYKLIWELLILLLRQNGTVVGTDISELLMSHRSAYPTPPSPATSHHSINEIPGQQNLQEEEVTNKFRELLLYGNTKEALEWAMKHGLWGHALFLASKMDQRTYASVMTRFANGLPLNDPLQTLYQLMSGRQPASVTCCHDEKWGDWRPHLAMILSNPSGRPEVDQKAITALGDSLGSRGALHAAHFCYLMAQVEFGTYAQKTSKVVLIGSSHSLPFHLFASNEAIFATEIFEFACNLADADFVLQHLQVYKLLLARRLAEVGMAQEAVHYAEVIATAIHKQPSMYPAAFIKEVYDLGSMLKFSDPVYTSGDNEGTDPSWLQQLLPILSDYQEGILQHQTYGGSVTNLTTCSEPEVRAGLVPASDNLASNRPADTTFQPQQQPQQQWQHDYQPSPADTFAEQPGETSNSYGPSSFDTSNYWSPYSSPNQWQPPADEQTSPMPVTPSDPTQHNPSVDYFETSRSEVVPTITMPGAGSNRQRTISQSSDGPKPPQSPQQQPVQRQQKNKESGGLQPQQQGSGWFGGFWNKLSLKPKNQMILPDDKNPAIVYDPDTGRWVDQQGNGDESSGGPLPPPPMAKTPPALTVAPATAADPTARPPPVSSANLYKMPRGKNLRANYVDVMNPGGGKSQPPPTVAAPDLFPSLSYPTQPAKLFTPSPGETPDNNNMPLFTPSLPAESGDSHPQGLSRWSSTSSLSREVQKYTGRRKVVASDGGWNSTLPRLNRSYI